MAKRELIDKNEIHFTCRRDCFTGDCTKCDERTVTQYEINEIPVITEEEIVKPYLEKLSKEISEVYEDEEYDGYNPNALGRFEERVQELIDSLLTDKGAEE